MCKICETKPVYEFSNGRTICSVCFTKWFQKKALYTIRKFNMLRKEDTIGYKKGNEFRDVVLEDILQMFSRNAIVELFKLPNKKKVSKIAISETTDLTSNEIIEQLIRGRVNVKKFKPVDGKVIKPLCLFTDKEVLLYAKIKNLKFKINKEKKDNLSVFIDELETKHPEIKHAIINGILGLE
jgi:hypothetical protein